MNNKITQNIITVLNALNNISVSGKQNLVNLSGSIGVLEEVLQLLNEQENTKQENNEN